MMNEKQLRLINWLYNFAIIEMKVQPHKFMDSDQIKLKEAVERRFPKYIKEITKDFE